MKRLLLFAIFAALGTGVLLHADMIGRCRGPWLQGALEAMQKGNGEVARLARQHGVVAATDVTGFGLGGHLAALAQRSGVAVEIDLDALPALPGALELLALGLRSTAHAANAAGRLSLTIEPGLQDDPRLELLFDPQTSGGLLLGIAPERAGALLDALHGAGAARATRIGRAREGRASITVGAGTLAARPLGAPTGVS